MKRTPPSAIASAIAPALVALLGCACAGVAACGGARDAATPGFTHEAYVWQRAWTPAVVDAVRARGPAFDGLRVWAAEIEAPRGASGARTVAHAAPPDGALAGLPVVLVVRIEGSAPLAAAEVAPVVTDALAAFDGLDVRGVEIDHDCATARLGAYAALLADVRPLIGERTLSITALPAWSAAGALDDVLAAVDAVVLQVHAVDAPAGAGGAADGEGAGLFSVARARGFVDAFAPRAARAGVGWRVALPAYGAALALDAGGRVVGIESEEPRGLRRAHGARGVREVWAAPDEVSALLRTLEVKRPRGLAGVVWFRLPVDGDRRAWSFATLEAVRAGKDLTPRFDVEVRASEGGARDVVLVNVGAVDATAPHRVELDVRGLVAADGVHGFALDDHGVHGFSSPHPPRVAAGGALVVGWVRAQEVTAHVAR